MFGLIGPRKPTAKQASAKGVGSALSEFGIEATELIPYEHILRY